MTLNAPAVKLTDVQQAAATHAGGPALVLAGAGSGKTRVIVERLAWLVGEQGVDAHGVLSLTFTNKAAQEMRDRVSRRLERDRVGIWLGTFHSFGLYILRREMAALGRSGNFTVFDAEDQRSVMKRCINGLMGEHEKVTPGDALQWLSLHKQDGTTNAPEPDGTPLEATYRALWDVYHATLFQASAVDFDDLLLLPYRIFVEHPDIRAKYQRRFHHIHVDEYQDTNRIQYGIIQNLAMDHGNILVVGDEDQSIYSWRGATIRNILDFERDFPSAKVYRLEQNFRSTAPILEAANKVVAHNTQRLGKTLWTAQKGGEPVLVRELPTGDEEADFILKRLKELDDPANCAILYRTNAQARVIEERMRLGRIPYIVVGGIKFYARKEVKDLIAYLRLLVNPSDEVSFRRILNVPARGIGTATIEHLECYARERQCTLAQVLPQVEHDQTLPARARAGISAFVHVMDSLTSKARESKKVAPIVQALIDATGYMEYLRKEDEKDFRTREEVVHEFIASCEQVDKKEPKGLEAFLQDLALVADVDDLDSQAASVTLMTCHSAKGLEFDHVFLAGMEESFLPHASSLYDENALEEERRLCYVAMTRARKTLTLTWAGLRYLYGELSKREPSRFLKDIPQPDKPAPRSKPLERKPFPKMVEAKNATRMASPAPPTPAAPAVSQRPAAARTPFAPPLRANAISEVAEEPGETSAFKTTARVFHASFGKGTVMYTVGSGAKQRVRVRFDTGKTREFLSAKAPMHVLEEKKR